MANWQAIKMFNSTGQVQTSGPVLGYDVASDVMPTQPASSPITVGAIKDGANSVLNRLPTGSIAILLFVILFILFAVQPAANGQSRLALLFFSLTGRASIPTDGATGGMFGGNNSSTFSNVVPPTSVPQDYSGVIQQSWGNW